MGFEPADYSTNDSALAFGHRPVILKKEPDQVVRDESIKNTMDDRLAQCLVDLRPYITCLNIFLCHQLSPHQVSIKKNKKKITR